ncbi:MAG: hypothetical protein FJ082_11765, partial [Cyanobacteria bacterium K_Offshore_surface_m2_011]|nr:hypothetical protein [Cyanobacteria bacterium K_Offshore_surface_m2_011]
ASKGVVGGAKSRVVRGRVQSSKCERPAESTKRRTYFRGITIDKNSNLYWAGSTATRAAAEL